MGLLHACRPAGGVSGIGASTALGPESKFEGRFQRTTPAHVQVGALVRCERGGRRARGVAGGAAGECVPVSRAAQGLYDEAAASPRRARAAGAAAVSAPTARSVWPVGGGRFNMFIIRIVKTRRNVDSPQLASLRPGTCYVVRYLRNLKRILRLLLPLS